MKIKNWKLKIALAFLSLVICVLALLKGTNAQEQRQSALGVSPAIVELILDPGAKKSITVIVNNVTNFPLPVKATAKSFLAKEEIPEEQRQIFDASEWFNIEPSDFILQPRQRKPVQIMVTAPKEAEPGGHYATVYFQPLVPVEVLSPQTAYLSARIGVLAFLVVKGEIVEEASLEKPEVPGLKSAFGGKIKYREFGPVEFKIPFKNAGNIHLMPAGEVKIMDFQGKEVENLKISPTTVLPQTTKELTVSWPKKHLLGKFTAQASFLYGSENKKLKSEPIEFWFIPWTPILFLICLLTIFTGLVILVRGRIILALKVLFGKAEVWEIKKLKIK